jgi:leader peptidase (prepilin peptidase)/N-methyltransferase
LVFVILILNTFFIGELGKLRTSITVSVLSFIFFYFVNLISKGGLGAGDVKLSATIGLITGYQGYLPAYVAFMFSFTFGSLFGLWLIVRHRAERKSKIAFGPFMYLGTLATLLLIM